MIDSHCHLDMEPISDNLNEVPIEHEKRTTEKRTNEIFFNKTIISLIYPFRGQDFILRLT